MSLGKIVGSIVGKRRRTSNKQVVYVVQRSPTLEERLEEFFEHGILAIGLWVIGNMIAEEMYKQVMEQYKKTIGVTSS